MGMIGIIGGSGLYDLPGLTDVRWVRCDTPWGPPSDDILLGTLQGAPLAFLPRHGRGHRIPPSEVNYRANVHALKSLGVTDLLSVSAVGSLREDLPPGTFVVVDQFIDRTVGRAASFFGAGLVAHVAMAHPVCRRVGDHVERALREAGVPHRRNGTYLAMEGPQFSTLAESRLYRSWQCDVIGMTNQPEARLAREAELCYASIAMVTDYDCWREEHGAVDVVTILKTLHANADAAKTIVRRIAQSFPAMHPPCPIGSDRALDNAIITPEAGRDPALMTKLDAITKRVFG